MISCFAELQDIATAKMSGCGSVLWMAPEILLGKKYNEKVSHTYYSTHTWICHMRATI